MAGLEDPQPISVNDHLMFLFTTIDAVRLAGAASITLVLPTYPYARQHKKAGREALTASLFARFCENLGVERIITLDIHSREIENSFSTCHLENLHGSYQTLIALRKVIDLSDPDLVVVAGLSRQMDIIETAAAFIRMAHSVMTYYSSTSLYINGVMLSADDVDEALQDISDDSFPVWFFARGGEEEMEDGTFVLIAEGAESFGAKIIKIVGVSQEYKEEASNALSLILVYHVFSPSARRSASYAIGDYIYQLSSSDKYTVSYSMKRGDHGRIQK